MCGVRRAIQVHSHAAHSGAHHECHGEHLIVSEAPGHASDCGSHVVEAAKVDLLRSLDLRIRNVLCTNQCYVIGLRSL